jgi:hypothetical protein
MSIPIFSILGLLIYPEAGGIRFLWNVSDYLQTTWHHIPEGKTVMSISILVNEMAKRQKETYLSYTFTFVLIFKWVPVLFLSNHYVNSPRSKFVWGTVDVNTEVRNLKLKLQTFVDWNLMLNEGKPFKLRNMKRGFHCMLFKNSIYLQEVRRRCVLLLQSKWN